MRCEHVCPPGNLRIKSSRELRDNNDDDNNNSLIKNDVIFGCFCFCFFQWHEQVSTAATISFVIVMLKNTASNCKTASHTHDLSHGCMWILAKLFDGNEEQYCLGRRCEKHHSLRVQFPASESITQVLPTAASARSCAKTASAELFD